MSQTRRTGATGSREETINTMLANVLSERHNLRTVPEQRIYGRSKIPDLTIRPSLECPHTIFGEAKVGTGNCGEEGRNQAGQGVDDHPAEERAEAPRAGAVLSHGASRQPDTEGNRGAPGRNPGSRMGIRRRARTGSNMAHGGTRGARHRDPERL